MNTEKFEAEFDLLLKEDVEQALSLITGMFVGLTIQYTRSRGYEAEKQIFIEGNENQRAITIHALDV